jgi:Mor family transcriptional regulator
MASRIFDEEQVSQIKEDHKNGISMKKLSSKYYCSLKTIYQVLHCKGAYSQKRTD